MRCRMHRIFWFLKINFLGISVLFSVLSWGAEITSIDFKGSVDPNEISIQSTGPITFEKQENPTDKQVIIEIKGATLSSASSKSIDTSSFKSKVSMISPYQVQGQSDTVRVVVQLRDFVATDVTQEGNSLLIKVPNDNPDVSALPLNPPVPSDNSTPTAPPLTSVDPPLPPTESPKLDVPLASPALTAVPPVEKKKKDRLDEFMENRAAQRFVGKPITLQLRDVDLSDVFRLIGDASGFNIILGDDVKGKITLSLIDVPWDQALDVVLHTARLGAERNNNILRIATLANLTQEKVDEINAKNAAKAAAPQVTRVFPINYANLSDLVGVLTKFATTSSGGGTGGGLALDNSVVQVDNRTNSIIVRDYPENIERMKKLVEILDTQTPQVLIEAKIVEATEQAAKGIDGSFGLGGSGGTSFFGSFNGGNPLDPLLGSPSSSSSGSSSGASTGLTGSAIATGSSGGGQFGLSPSISFLPGINQINAALGILENESQIKIISSPKTVVLNKQKANIVESTPVLVPTANTTVPGGTTISGNSVQQANISLAVTPTVTNDGSVLLDLSVTRDIPYDLGKSQKAIANRNLTTQVLVDTGSTLVIGGVYSVDTTHSAGGMPFLRKIPILGALFGYESDSTTRTELFIFVTPRIINLKEAGLNT